jgi:serine/threonine protein kinase
MTPTDSPATSRRGWLRQGTQLNGMYEIDHPVGSGGMGEIYRGHEIETRHAVAIKIMLPEFAESATALALFRKEAAALRHLQHDAIVRYHAFAVAPVLQRPYLAMEFVDGRALGTLGTLGFPRLR